MNPPFTDDDQIASLKLMVVLSKAYKSMMEEASKDIKNYGLSPSEFGIMEVLYTKGKVALQQIGEKMLITSGTMTYNVDKLEKRDLIKRIPCQEDRRVIYAELTVKGREMFDLIFPQHTANMQQMMSGLSKDQKQELIQLLKQLGKGEHSHDQHISDN